MPFLDCWHTTGMRLGELCALQWTDVDFASNTISITKTYYNPTNKTTNYLLLPPKTKNSRRVIEIDASVIKDLERHYAKQRIQTMKFRDSWHNNNFIFTLPSNPGYPLYLKAVGNWMAQILRKANSNPSLTPHSLRHTHTSLLSCVGVSLEEIMDRLGHSDDTITRTVYLHITKEKKKEASRKFAELMQGL